MSSLPRDLEKKLGPSSAEIDPKFKQKLKQSLFKEKKMAASNPFTRFLKYTRSAPALATLTALIIVGSASGLVATHQANNARQAEIEVPANIDNLLSFEDVRAIADKDTSNGPITGIELEKEDNGMVYKVKFSDGSIRIYDAKTGKAVSDSSKEENDDNIPAHFNSNITAAQARSIALKQRSGTITKIELETEEGVIVYSVRFSDGGRVDVSVANGAVLRVRGASNTDTSSSGTTTTTNDSSSASDSTSDDNGGSSNSGSGSSGGSDDSGLNDDHSGSNSGSSGSGGSGHGSDD
jgi:uncharacterized membrane protein YkoI